MKVSLAIPLISVRGPILVAQGNRLNVQRTQMHLTIPNDNRQEDVSDLVMILKTLTCDFFAKKM